MSAAAIFDIFDVHQHVGSTGSAHGLVRDDQMHGAGLDQNEISNRLSFMDAVGIRQSLAIPGHAYNRAQGARATMAQNDAIAAYRDANPGRFPIGIGVVEPLDEQAAVDEVVRMADELGLRGISFHTEYQGVTIDSPWMMKIIEKMIDKGIMPLIHASNVVLHEALWRLAKVARAFPETTILALEPFYTFEGIQQCSFIADVAPNIIFDTASCAEIGSMLALAKEIGADRIVYGSQYYSATRPYGANPVPPKGKIILDAILATDKLDDPEKAAILGGNARRIFEL